MSLTAMRRRHVKGDRELAGVDVVVPAACVQAILALGLGVKDAQAIDASMAFYTNDLRAVVSQYLGAGGPGREPGEVDHSDAFQG